MTDPHRVRIKICGITLLQDALSAVAAGVDALGFVFYAQSPRRVSVETAQNILRQLPPFITTVGLFVDEKTDTVHEILEKLPLDALQFHGDETEQYCQQYARPYIKAMRVQETVDLNHLQKYYQSAQAFLLDSYAPTAKGGTGTCFDWSLMEGSATMPIVLAGGLNAANVQTAITQIHPYAVDVSSGVETAPGIKSAHKIQAFVNAVQHV